MSMSSATKSSCDRTGSVVSGQGNSHKMDAPKRRVLLVACVVSACLLINMIVTVSISTALAEWGLSTDSWLRCTLSGSWSNRDHAAHSLIPNQVVCKQEDIALSHAGKCAGDCRWGVPHITGSDLNLFCPMSPNVDFDSLNPETAADLVKTVNCACCDCSCDAFVQVER